MDVAKLEKTVIARPALFLFAVSLLFCCLVAVGGAFWLRARRAASGSLETLLGRLHIVDRHSIALMAIELEDAPGADPEQSSLEGWQIWEMLGGLEGLERMAANCQVLIDLACYVQQWHPEALVLAEDLRRNAREIQWHLGRLKGAQTVGHLEASFPDYAPRAAALYYTMTRRVLERFEASQTPGAGQLQQVL